MTTTWKRRLIRQPHGKPLCGQCCLAVINMISLDEAIELVGHSKSTKSKELTSHFNAGPNKHGFPTTDALCITRRRDLASATGKAEKGNWHWILFWRGQIYDPLRGKLIDKDIYFDKYPHLKVASHFPIL